MSTFTLLYIFFFASGSLYAAGGRTLKLIRVNVPQYRLRGETADLECLYELGDDALYSVKWYKDDEEFYRFVPKSVPRKYSYKVDGIRVDDTSSNDKIVVLRNVNHLSSGYYRCEVSAEAPSFASVQQEGRMIVVSLPKDGPHISGEEKLYQVGEDISLNCTSGKSFPASQLQWFINDQAVPPDDDRLELYPGIRHHNGLMTSTLGLRFIVTGDHFIQGSMRLRCVAEVSPVLWQGDRESVVQRMTSETIREALFLVRGSSARTYPTTLLPLLATVFIIIRVT